MASTNAETSAASAGVADEAPFYTTLEDAATTTAVKKIFNLYFSPHEMTKLSMVHTSAPVGATGKRKVHCAYIITAAKDCCCSETENCYRCMDEKKIQTEYSYLVELDKHGVAQYTVVHAIAQARSRDLTLAADVLWQKFFREVHAALGVPPALRFEVYLRCPTGRSE